MPWHLNLPSPRAVVLEQFLLVRRSLALRVLGSAVSEGEIMTNSGRTPMIAKVASTAIVATGLLLAIAPTSAQSATVNLTHGLPDNVVLDPGYADAWWGKWKGRANVAAMQEAVEGLAGAFDGLALTDPLKLDGLSGGQDSVFTYAGEARIAFAIKSGRLWTAILFSDPTTNWTITGLDHEISQLVGFNGDTISPVPAPPAAVLFLTGLLGIGLLARRRGRWTKRRQI